MRLTTRTYDQLARKESLPPIAADPSLGADFSGGAPSFSTGDSTGQMIADFLQEMTADDMRRGRASNIWADIAIRHRIDAVRDQDWKVGAHDPKQTVDGAIQTEIVDLLEAPNPQLDNNTFGGLFGAATDDVLTIGRGALQALLNRNLTPYALRALDAARLRQNPYYDPSFDDVPTSPDDKKRWLYAETEVKTIPFSSPEIVLLVPYLSTYDRTGLAPMKALRNILQAELDTRRGMHIVQKYRTPPGVFIMPGAAPGSPEKMRLMYDLKMAGRATIGFMNLPKDSHFVQFGGINLIQQGTFQFYEILVRATAAAFGTTPFVLGWTDQDNRANSQTQLSITDRGEAALLKFLRQIINRSIIGRWTEAYGSRAGNLWFTFTSLREEDMLEDAQSLRTKAGPVGFISINELRAAAGLFQYTRDEIPEELWPFVAEPWMPSRIPGVMLPLTYAAMSFGIVEGANLELLVAGMQTGRNPTPTPPGEVSVEQEPGEEEPEVSSRAAFRLDATKAAYLGLFRQGLTGDASNEIEKIVTDLRHLIAA